MEFGFRSYLASVGAIRAVSINFASLSTVELSGEYKVKKKWIFIRGLARENAHWGDFVLEFQTKHPEAEVLLLDLKGNGETFQLVSPTHISEFCEDLRIRSASFRQNQPVCILSVSLGAMVALDWASRYPHEIHQVVAVNTSSSLSHFYQRLRPSALFQLCKIAWTRDIEQKERQTLSLVAPKALENQPHLVELFANVHRQRPVHWRNFIRQLWAARQMQLSPKAPPVEVLLINSLGDRMVHPVCTEQITQYWGLRHRTHPWGGHDLPLEDATWLIDQMT